MSTAVKHLHSGMTGAPVLSGSAGALIAVLDAALVNGWGVATIDSLSVTSGVATATLSAGHAAEVGTVVEVSGVTAPTALNGAWRAVAVTATTVTWPAPGIPDGAATGSMQLKIAPLGWAKPFAGTSKGAYRSQDPMGTQFFVRVDDTGTTEARVVGYESMTDVDTGVDPFPTAAQQSGGLYWGKSQSANASARAWAVVGDGRLFFLLTARPNSQVAPLRYCVQAFGDASNLKPSGDAYGCYLSGYRSNGFGGGTGSLVDCLGSSSYSDASMRVYSARGVDGLVKSVVFRNFGLGASPSSASDISTSGDTAGITSGSYYAGSMQTYPSPVTGGLVLFQVALMIPAQIRSIWPGLYHTPQAVGDTFLSGAVHLPTEGDLVGRRMVAYRVGAFDSLGKRGTVWMDTTGPWR